MAGHLEYPLASGDFGAWLVLMMIATVLGLIIMAFHFLRLCLRTRRVDRAISNGDLAAARAAMKALQSFVEKRITSNLQKACDPADGERTESAGDKIIRDAEEENDELRRMLEEYQLKVTQLQQRLKRQPE